MTTDNGLTIRKGMVQTSEIRARLERAYGQARRAYDITVGLPKEYDGRVQGCANLEHALHSLASAAANLGLEIDVSA